MINECNRSIITCNCCHLRFKIRISMPREFKDNRITCNKSRSESKHEIPISQNAYFFRSSISKSRRNFIFGIRCRCNCRTGVNFGLNKYFLLIQNIRVDHIGSIRCINFNIAPHSNILAEHDIRNIYFDCRSDYILCESSYL